MPGSFANALTHLQPFELDYFQTFYTLCDILIEVYQKINTFLGSPTTAAAAAASSSSATSSPFVFGQSPPQQQQISPQPPQSQQQQQGPVPSSASSGTAGTSTSAASTTTATTVTTTSMGGTLSPALADMVQKIDGKLKKTLSAVTKELDALARAAIKDELNALAGGGAGVGGAGGVAFDSDWTSLASSSAFP
jgi:hypothetical protein